jgi:hypothetical protein
MPLSRGSSNPERQSHDALDHAAATLENFANLFRGELRTACAKAVVAGTLDARAAAEPIDAARVACSFASIRDVPDEVVGQWLAEYDAQRTADAAACLLAPLGPENPPRPVRRGGAFCGHLADTDF